MYRPKICYNGQKKAQLEQQQQHEPTVTHDLAASRLVKRLKGTRLAEQQSMLVIYA